MAVMIPGKPLDVDPSSKEDIIFDILKKKLPDDYYICHSVKVHHYDKKNQPHDCEIDFLILVPNKGALIVESKAGQVHPGNKPVLSMGEDTDYIWYYGDGTPMSYSGPFAQVRRAMYIFCDFVNDGIGSGYGFRKKIYPATCICFPSVDKSTINLWKLPPDGDKKIILSKEDILGSKENLVKKIDYLIELAKKYYCEYYAMSKPEIENFIKSVIAPCVNLIPSKDFWLDIKKNKFNSFIHDQMIVLDFLEEQKIAAIQGAAGTGKTMIAIEKAMRLSKSNKVLFLCYNSNLKDKLSKDYENENIRYETIDSLANAYLNYQENYDYTMLKKLIDDDCKNGKFLYHNFIIDEAQDFGKKEIENSEILALFKTIAELYDDGTFYLFYDKYQKIQGSVIPKTILDCDCKISLFKNCRNTKKIAKTSYKLFKPEELPKRRIEGFESGEDTKAIICEKNENEQKLDKMINYYENKGFKEITILTTKTIESSSISNKLRGNSYILSNNKRYPIYTCRTFKGLESEVIILIDIDDEILLDNDDRLLFYVGTSRAKYELGLIFNVSDNGWENFSKLHDCGGDFKDLDVGLFFESNVEF